MKKDMKKFLTSQRGINTVEVVIILAVVVGLAIIFRERIGYFANGIMDTVFRDTNINDLSPDAMRNYVVE